MLSVLRLMKFDPQVLIFSWSPQSGYKLLFPKLIVFECKKSLNMQRKLDVERRLRGKLRKRWRDDTRRYTGFFGDSNTAAQLESNGRQSSSSATI